MAKKIVGFVKLQVPAGKANPAPPIGPALGQRGLNIMEFCKAFNAQTQGLEPGLPIPVRELYERLKQRGVLVVAGDYFFFGDDRPDWPHRHECIRVTYSMDEGVVRDGLRIIAEEVRRCQK
jgi:hypothetical protein